jgi:hypothetical protein
MKFAAERLPKVKAPSNIALNDALKVRDDINV